MDAPVETGETPIRDASPSFRCLLCNTEVVHKIAHVLLQGLATSCVDNTTGDLFKEPRSVAVDIRKEMVDYLTERSESIIAESFLLQQEGGGSNDVIEVSDHPTEVITDIVDDFAGLKRNFMGKVSGWLLSENREDRIDDFIQEMEKTGFWMIDRRKVIAELILINVDYKNAYHCDLRFETESEVDEHRMKCEFRPVRCTNVGCNATFCAMQKDEHDSICSLKILNCEQNCEQMIIRKEMDRHCITVCPMKLVNCPFFQVGCESTVPQCKIRLHCADFLHSHIIHVLQLIHKNETSADDFEEQSILLEKAQSENELTKALDIRSLTNEIKKLEKKMKRLEDNKQQ